MRHIVWAAGPFEYFCRKVSIGLPDQCWEWQGSVGGPGYGNWCFDVPGFLTKTGTAHRRAYALFKEHPGRLHVLHRCGNRRCCNPDHLYLGTDADNHVDTVRHGRYSPPPNFYGQQVRNQYGQCKLSEDDVLAIRNRRIAGEKGRDLAKEYKVSEQVISKIYRRQSFTWVTQ